MNANGIVPDVTLHALCRVCFWHHPGFGLGFSRGAWALRDMRYIRVHRCFQLLCHHMRFRFSGPVIAAAFAALETLAVLYPPYSALVPSAVLCMISNPKSHILSSTIFRLLWDWQTHVRNSDGSLLHSIPAGPLLMVGLTLLGTGGGGGDGNVYARKGWSTQRAADGAPAVRFSRFFRIEKEPPTKLGWEEPRTTARTQCGANHWPPRGRGRYPRQPHKGGRATHRGANETRDNHEGVRNAHGHRAERWSNWASCTRQCREACGGRPGQHQKAEGLSNWTSPGLSLRSPQFFSKKAHGSKAPGDHQPPPTANRQPLLTANRQPFEVEKVP